MKWNVLLGILILCFFPLLLFGEVVDGAGMFSKGAISEADKIIAEAKEKHGKNLVIETVKGTGGMDIKEFALKQAKEKHVDGIYILISKENKKIELLVGKKTGTLFTPFERGVLKSKLIEEFKSKNFDKGLTSCAGNFAETLASASNKPIASRSESMAPMQEKSSGGFSWGMIALIGLGIFIIFRIISYFKSRNQMASANQQPGYSPYQQQGQQPGGGMFGGRGPGLMGGLMAGVFGAMAGSWIYDKLTGRDNLHASDSGNFGNRYEDSADTQSWSSPDDDNYESDSGSWDSGSDSGGGDW